MPFRSLLFKISDSFLKYNCSFNCGKHLAQNTKRKKGTSKNLRISYKE